MSMTIHQAFRSLKCIMKLSEHQLIPYTGQDLEFSTDRFYSTSISKN